MKLFTAFVFLCVVGTALAATTLKLNSQLTGSLVSGAQTYQFSYSHGTSSRYQMLYVLPQLEEGSSAVPVVKIDKTNVIDFKSDVSCSASASSSSGQIKCAYSFQGCVKTSDPQDYTITVSPPGLAANANINFTIGAINIAAGLSAATQTLTKQVTCCGFSGASWHHVQASGAEVINSVSITVTSGSLTTSSMTTGDGLSSLLPPGVFIIPDTSICTDLSLASFLKAAKNIDSYAKALANFAANLSADSETRTVKVSLTGDLATPGVSYWVLVVPTSDSSAQYTISTEFSGTSSAAALATPFSALF